MKKNLSTFLKLLSSRELKRAISLIILLVLVAILDAAGVASIMPFIALLVNPSLIETNSLLAHGFTLAQNFGVDSKIGYLALLGFLVFLILMLSLASRAYITFAQTQFAFMWEYKISKNLVENYLGQPYEWFLQNHGADLNKNVLSEVNIVVMHCVIPILTVFSQGAVILAILILLFLVNFTLSLTIGMVLISVYALIFGLSSKYLANLSGQRFDANRNRFRILDETFSAIKEVKLFNLETAYLKIFKKHALEVVKYQTAATILGQMPRFALEALVFGGMLSVTLFLMVLSGSFLSALPTISLFAFAGYRLMPALQQVYSALTQIRFATPSITALSADLSILKKTSHTQKANVENAKVEFQKRLVLEDISFKHQGANKPTLSNLSMKILPKTSIGLVGATGSGKTTLVDIILCLLSANQGKIIADDIELNNRTRAGWQKLVGYVPQQIFLKDDTIISNIAFSQTIDDIDEDAVMNAAKIAQIHDFICNELSDKYYTYIGENGVRLSGGQRQRIGIARALYRNPEILILDEATSALDNSTEKAVVEAVQKLKRKITTIQISHRLTTLKHCDKIYWVKDGGVTEISNFDELMSLDIEITSTD